MIRRAPMVLVVLPAWLVVGVTAVTIAHNYGEAGGLMSVQRIEASIESGAEPARVAALEADVARAISSSRPASTPR